MDWTKCFAGNDSKPGLSGYYCELPQGEYSVFPVSEETDFRKHLGYAAWFRPRWKGKTTFLGQADLFKSARLAKQACEKHYRETGRFLPTSRQEAFGKAGH